MSNQRVRRTALIAATVLLVLVPAALLAAGPVSSLWSSFLAMDVVSTGGEYALEGSLGVTVGASSGGDYEVVGGVSDVGSPPPEPGAARLFLPLVQRPAAQ